MRKSDMKMFILGLLLILFGLLMLSAIAMGQESPRPTEVLLRAVAKTRACGGYTVTKTRIEKGGREREIGPGEEDARIAKKLSLPILFRPGRFNLSYGADYAVVDEKEAFVVSFAPRPKSSELKAAGSEDEYYNTAMNRLTGNVSIDTETGGLMRIDGKLSEPVPYTWWGIKIFELQTLDFTLDQVNKGTKWSPDRFQVRIKYWRIVGASVEERIDLRFSCK